MQGSRELVGFYEAFLSPFVVLVRMMDGGKVEGLPPKEQIVGLKSFICKIQINPRFVFSLEVRETRFETFVGEVQFIVAPPAYCSRAHDLHSGIVSPGLAKMLLRYLEDWGDCPVKRLEEKHRAVARLRKVAEDLES